MSFFDQIGKRITDAGQGVAQQTKNFADVTRLNSAISDKEKRISQLYQSIGKTYYERHSDDAESEQQQAVDEIKGLLAEIAQHKEEIKQIKGIVKCPNCGGDVPSQAAFCNACGFKMAQDIPTPEAQAPAGETRVCPVCGAVSSKSNLFCTNCGSKFIEEESQEE